MNVTIFNRVNNPNKDSGGMYSEWSSLPLEGGGRGVLGAVGGRDVVLAVVKQLASHEPSPLTTDAEVEWVLEVIRFGLSLPLQEHEALRDCVRVCCAWLAPLLPPAPPAMPPPPALPPPVAAAPHKYARKILRHLHNLFVPRPNETLTFIYQMELGGDLISKQAVLCHRVLRLARALGAGGALGARDWAQLLLLLLAAAAALLSPPAPHHSAAEQLCERVLCVLFEVWILACHRCFPAPPLWRTLREQCVRWRHRAPLTEQWTRASLALTARLLKHMYGPLFPVMPISEEDANLIPPDMSAEAVMQSWYRILHTIGNPVDLCRPHVISQTPDFLQYSITQDEGSRDPSQHPCLQALPSIFHKAMKGIAAHVDAFLGRGSERWWGAGAGAPDHDDGDLTPPAHRRLAKSFSVSAARPRDKLPERSTPRTSLIGLTSSRPPSVAPTTPPNSITSQVGESEKPPLTPLRPKVNSILHLFGEWLFEAALIGTTPQYNNQQRTEGTPPPPSLSDATYKLNMLSYQPGRAEALGTLCRVLCSKQCREEVHPPYLARCYAALHRGLRDPATAAAVVLNAPDIFRLDLDGVLVLVPDFINALDQILSEREPRLECGNIDKRELRKAAISALLSLVAFPYHYKGLPVPEFPGCNE
ncbi:ral GTPase-activating protein subunit beta-like [Spodoptera litura]|uniref:Ral GTPase-activating protein subunit beta-like n=1 Tax=Spodoptera litura TaxID=69820 RepID=A0A9J7E9F7_SPOLT|nr:ral GTPase-activating protein subunit beta-like [Spodoptera litura]